MREFFRGWRRKVGMVTLLMALGFTGAWVRSLNIGDQFRIPSDDATHSCIVSGHDGLVWFYFHETGRMHLSRSRNWYKSVKLMTRFYEDFFIKESNFIDADIIDWRVDFYGLCFAEGHREGFRKGIAIVPYRFIVIPLTAIAAFLLLSKPRHSTPKKTTEPIAEKGV
jgi:hypothetical protein